MVTMSPRSRPIIFPAREAGQSGPAETFQIKSEFFSLTAEARSVYEHLKQRGI
jgi:hypothetical protein